MATSKLKQISIGLVSYQSGDGFPDHIANTGTIYVDNLTGNAYKYNGSSWQYILTEISNVNVLVNGNLTVTGNTSLQSLSASTFFSGSTNLYSIFQQIGTDSQTFVQPGTNIYTGGTSFLPTINVSALTINTITVSGNTTLNSATATTISGGTIFSGSTDLNVFFNKDRAQIETKVNRSGDTFTGHVNTPSLSAVTLTANTINIIGNSDVTELTIKANSSQTQSLIRLLKSDDTELSRLHSNSLENLFLGYSAGTSITSGLYNTFLGSTAGTGNTTGGVNVFIGHQAGSVISGGVSNTFIGAGAGKIKTSGDFNVYFGANAGGNTLVGDNNVYVGDWSGRFNYSGANNTYIGQASGYLSSGSGNVFIGKLAGMSISGSNLLFISNSSTPNPLIFGDFSTSQVKINGGLSANSLSATTISGGTLYSGSTNLYSIFATIPDQNDITRVQPGTNTYTGGTDNNPTVNVSALTVNTITASGSSIFTGGLSANTLSGGTILSGSTNLYSIFATIPDQNDVTRVQPGTNTYTGGTDNNPTVNISALTISTLVASGSSQLSTVTATSVSGGTVSGGTLFSGSTNLYNIFQPQTGVLLQKNGSVTGTTFSGNPKKAVVTFSAAFPDNNYAITITGEASRSWSVESKSATGFTINANANLAFTQNVYWMAGQIGESN